MTYRKIALLLGTISFLAAGCGDDGSESKVCGDRTCHANENCVDNVCVIMTDLCAGKTCLTGTCNPATGQCEGGTVDLCAGKTCTPGTCNPATGQCEGGTVDLCAGKTCTSGTCNPATGQCEGGTVDLCAGKTCTTGACNPATGQCEGACTPGCESWQFCSLAGNCVNYKGACANSGECANPTDTCSPEHKCVAACETEVEGNVIPNWSFEDWQDSKLEYWDLYVPQYSDAKIKKSDQAAACNHAVEIINTASNNARLESDPFHLPEITHLQNDKYDCTVKVGGTGEFYVGYRTTDNKGNTEDRNTNKKYTVEDDDYKDYTFTMSIAPEVVQVEALVGVKKTDSNKGVLVDTFSCVRNEGYCDNKTCNEWEICTTANYGECVPRDGFCNPTKGCSAAETCDETTHRCKRIDGGCLTHEDCADGSLKFCNSTSHKCESGDPCSGVTCKSWEQCNARTGKCGLKDGSCVKSSDCVNKDKPACYNAEHTCVEVGYTYTVSKASDCPVTGYNKTTKACPVNIVPNGGFESWSEYSFGESTTKHLLPVSWYGEIFDVDATHFASEIDPEYVKKYTSSTHSGAAALQIEFTKQPAERFTSEGFTVPEGPFDCSFWVRGKGEVRVHSYSSRGEAKHTDFVSYSTTEWTRVPFSIKEASSAMRIIFYVSNTDASMDHIQIDDVVCTKYAY